MSIFCKGEHCPVRKQCQKYVDGRINPVFEGDKEIKSCRNQRLFIKADDEYYHRITQQAADELLKSFEDFDKAFAPLPETMNKFADESVC